MITTPRFATPANFCEILQSVDFLLYCHRQPSAPDLQLRAEDFPRDVIQDEKPFRVSVTGPSEEPSRSAQTAALAAQGRARHTVLDLDTHSMFWTTAAEATEQVRKCLGQVTGAVGNREECQVAVGGTELDRAAEALLEAGVEVAIVKQGTKGTLAKTRDERVVVPPTPIDVVNGLGAGDAFGGSLCHGLLIGWTLEHSAAGAILASRLESVTAIPSADEVEGILAGARFEMDGPFTGHDARGVAAVGLDGRKMLMRTDYDDPGTTQIVESCARAVDELAGLEVMAIVEPLISGRVDGKVHKRPQPPRRHPLHRDHLGPGPHVDLQLAQAALRVGDGTGHGRLDHAGSDTRWRGLRRPRGDSGVLGQDPRAIALPTVKGVVIGRPRLHPPGDDVAAAVDNEVGLL